MNSVTIHLKFQIKIAFKTVSLTQTVRNQVMTVQNICYAEV
jgi:hypothetical protein